MIADDAAPPAFPFSDDDSNDDDDVLGMVARSGRGEGREDGPLPLGRPTVPADGPGRDDMKDARLVVVA